MRSSFHRVRHSRLAPTTAATIGPVVEVGVEETRPPWASIGVGAATTATFGRGNIHGGPDATATGSRIASSTSTSTTPSTGEDDGAEVRVAAVAAVGAGLVIASTPATGSRDATGSEDDGDRRRSADGDLHRDHRRAGSTAAACTVISWHIAFSLISCAAGTRATTATSHAADEYGRDAGWGDPLTSPRWQREPENVEAPGESGPFVGPREASAGVSRSGCGIILCPSRR